MKGIVWGLTTIDAIKKMEQIEKNYEMYRTANVLTRRKSNSTYELVYDNGDIVIPANTPVSFDFYNCSKVTSQTRLLFGFIFMFMHLK